MTVSIHGSFQELNEVNRRVKGSMRGSVDSCNKHRQSFRRVDLTEEILYVSRLTSPCGIGDSNDGGPDGHMAVDGDTPTISVTIMSDQRVIRNIKGRAGNFRGEPGFSEHNNVVGTSMGLEERSDGIQTASERADIEAATME